MATKAELTSWTIAALRALGGSAHLIDVAKWIWANHEDELRGSGDLFYTWQYDVRWAATNFAKIIAWCQLPCHPKVYGSCVKVANHRSRTRDFQTLGRCHWRVAIPDSGGG